MNKTYLHETLYIHFISNQYSGVLGFWGFGVGLRVFFDFRVGFKVLCFIMLDAFAFFVQGSGLLIFGWGLRFHVFA